MIPFVHLHVHSEYSVLDGMSKISQLVDKAIKCGMTSIALTDHGSMFGIKEFFNYCKAKEGFKPIFGCEVYVAKQTDTNPSGSRLMRENKENQSGYHLILLAKNLQGYRNLCKIVSAGWTDGFYSRPRIDRDLLEKYHEGIIASSACLAGEIHRNIQKEQLSAAREVALWYKNLFGEDFYLELQRHKTDKKGGDTAVFIQQEEQNKELVRIAKELDIKLIVTNDVHFVEEEHGDAHDLLICLSTGKFIDDENRMHYTKQEWLKSPEEMAAIFFDFPEAIANTQEVADKVESYSINSVPQMPMFDIPENFGTEEEYRARYSFEDMIVEFEADEKRLEEIGGYDKAVRIKLEADYLRKLTYEGAKERYGENISDDIKERIDFELKTMQNMGYPGYFLIVQDLIKAAREMDVSVGPGRGSAAGSVVAYCLKITDIDPLKYDLLFERFLNPDRISLPDIDIDFEDSGRNKVFDWVTNKYGKEKVAKIVTYGTMATKASIKDVTRVLHLPIALGNQLTKMIPTKFSEDSDGKTPKISIPNCKKWVPDIKKAMETDKNVRKIFEYAEQLEGTVRQIGSHACGVIIGADDIINSVPVNTIEDKESGQRIITTQYEGTAVEDVGLIKMDFLGLSTLTIIKECLKIIKKRHDIDIDHIPIDDALTYQLFSEGNTIGIFQFESPGMQKHLKALKPTVFEDLIAMNALYRPGPMQYVPSFINRKHGKEAIEYDFPIMEQRLKETYGVTVYQEQVMLLSRDLAGFTRGQSDELRKAMGKKIQTKMDSLKVKFIDGATKNGFGPQKKLEKIWNDWAEFAKYAFNKSHATCYSWVAYQTAYLKAHYPAEFFAANLTCQVNNLTEVAVLVEDANRMNIQILGPDINESDVFFTVNKKEQIRFGLSALKGSGISAAENIVNERNENGIYESVFDFLKRVNLRICNKKTVDALVSSGAFDCFSDIHRAQYFQETARGQTIIELLLQWGAKIQSEQAQAQISLFDANPDAVTETSPEIPNTEEWSFVEKLKNEKEICGFYISGHPLDQYKLAIQCFTNTHLGELNDENNFPKLSGKLLQFAGIVTSHQKMTDKNGREYGRIKFEDQNNEFSWMLFRELYSKFKHLFDVGSQLFIKATVKVSSYMDADKNPVVRYNLEPADMFVLEDIYEKMCKEVFLYLNINDINTSLAQELEKGFQDCKGKYPLFIKIISNDEKTNVDFCNFTIKINLEKVLKELKLQVWHEWELR